MLPTSPVLIISGEQAHRAQLADHVFKFGLRPVCCETIADARALAEQQPFSAAVSEDQLPDGDFRAVITEMRRHAAHSPVVVVSGRDDWDFLSFHRAPGSVRFGGFSADSRRARARPVDRPHGNKTIGRA